MSIKKNKGRCPVCKAKVLDNNYPTDNVGIDGNDIHKSEKALWCNSCFKNGVGTILGTVKDDVPNSVIDASRMYDGINFDKAEKILNKTISREERKLANIEELEQKCRQLEFANGMLQGNMAQLKTMHEKELKERDKRIQALTNEINELEHRIDYLVKLKKAE